MSLNLRILLLLHKTYQPSAAIELTVGRNDLTIQTDHQGEPHRVTIRSKGQPETSGQSYIRKDNSLNPEHKLPFTWIKEMLG